jgi:predicted PurR-regulated permease PerM
MELQHWALIWVLWIMFFWWNQYGIGGNLVALPLTHCLLVLLHQNIDILLDENKTINEFWLQIQWTYVFLLFIKHRILSIPTTTTTTTTRHCS